MVNREKVLTKKLLRFKQAHFNNLVTELTNVKIRKEGDITFEDIYFDGIHYAYFMLKDGKVSFVKCRGVNSCAVESKDNIAEMNSLPQS